MVNIVDNETDSYRTCSATEKDLIILDSLLTAIFSSFLYFADISFTFFCYCRKIIKENEVKRAFLGSTNQEDCIVEM